jgi:hypothetical protein
MKPPKILYWCVNYKCDYYVDCLRQVSPIDTTCKHNKKIYDKREIGAEGREIDTKESGHGK